MIGDARKYLSVMTPASASGSLSFTLQTYNASPNVTLTVTVTGITAGMPEEVIAGTICNQASAAMVAQGSLFQGWIGTITSPVTGAWQTAFTGHVVSLFSLAQFAVLNVTDIGTGVIVFEDSSPVLCTVNEALMDGPLSSQLLQACGGTALSTSQIINLLAMASADVCAITRNDFIQSWYVFQLTTNITNAIRFPNYPVVFYYNPFDIRPTIIQIAAQVAIFDLPTRYSVDYQTGWCTFRYAQDLLFNYEPFDMNNQWFCAYLAGFYQIPREVKTAVLRWSYVCQAFSNITEMWDGITKITWSVDKNIEKRNIFAPLKARGYNR